MNGNIGEGWLRRQKLLPKCIAVDVHLLEFSSLRYDYIFESNDYVMRLYVGKNEHVSIEDYYNDDVLAYSDGINNYDNVRCAEQMYETSRGSEYVDKEIVDSIIYKLMVGDIMLIED